MLTLTSLEGKVLTSLKIYRKKIDLSLKLFQFLKFFIEPLQGIYATNLPIKYFLNFI